jgi:hypothetical protein
MRIPVLLQLVLVARVAHAQPVGEVREDTEPAKPTDTPLTSAADTFLHLDIVPVTADNLGSQVEHMTRQLALGQRRRVVLQTTWREVDHGIPLHGWRTAASGSYDLGGGIELTASAGVEHVDSNQGRHSLRTLAVAVGKRFRLSRAVHGWIGITATSQTWTSKPPPGESDTRQIMVTGKLSY